MQLIVIVAQQFMPPNHSVMRAYRNHWLWSPMMRYYWKLQNTRNYVCTRIVLGLDSIEQEELFADTAHNDHTLHGMKRKKCLMRCWSAHSTWREQWKKLPFLPHTSIDGIKLHQFVNFIDSVWEKQQKAFSIHLKHFHSNEHVEVWHFDEEKTIPLGKWLKQMPSIVDFLLQPPAFVHHWLTNYICHYFFFSSLHRKLIIHLGTYTLTVQFIQGSYGFLQWLLDVTFP